MYLLLPPPLPRMFQWRYPMVGNLLKTFCKNSLHYFNHAQFVVYFCFPSLSLYIYYESRINLLLFYGFQHYKSDQFLALL